MTVYFIFLAIAALLFAFTSSSVMFWTLAAPFVVPAFIITAYACLYFTENPDKIRIKKYVSKK